MRADSEHVAVPIERSGPKVLIVSPQPFYEDRGTPIAVGQLAAALATLDYRVDLLTYPIGEDVRLQNLRILRGARVPGIRSVPIGFSTRKVLLDLALLKKVWSAARRERYLIVHALEEIALPVIWLCRRRGLPVIYDMQSSLPDQLHTHWFFGSKPMQSLLKRFERWMLRNADAVVCSAGLGSYVNGVAPGALVTEWRFAGQLRGDRDEALVQLRAMGLPDGARVVLYTGTFEPYQGIDTLIDAMPAVLAAVPDAVFVLVGATDDDILADPRVRHLTAKQRLLIVSRQPRRAIPAYLATADVLVSPREFGDNVPLKVFDYMLSGVPIVATDIAAHRSLLNEQTAMLVQSSPEALAEAIVGVLQDPELARSLSSAALEAAGRYPGGDSFVDLVRDLYDGTLGIDERR
jgi:glycosyltransferase involved in cell wall biosynthesis